MEYTNLLIFIGFSLIIIPLFVRFYNKRKNRRFNLMRLKQIAGSISSAEAKVYWKEYNKRYRPPLCTRIGNRYKETKKQTSLLIDNEWNNIVSKFKKKEKKEKKTQRTVAYKDVKRTPPGLITGEDNPKPNNEPLTTSPNQLKV